MRPREVGAEVVVTGGPAADARAEPLGLGVPLRWGAGQRCGWRCRQLWGEPPKGKVAGKEGMSGPWLFLGWGVLPLGSESPRV